MGFASDYHPQQKEQTRQPQSGCKQHNENPEDKSENNVCLCLFHTFNDNSVSYLLGCSVLTVVYPCI